MEFKAWTAPSLPSTSRPRSRSAERARTIAHESGDPPLTNPITGAGCCARDESNYVTTAKPSAAANFRLADGDIHWKARHGSQPLINRNDIPFWR